MRDEEEGGHNFRGGLFKYFGNVLYLKVLGEYMIVHYIILKYIIIEQSIHKLKCHISRNEAVNLSGSSNLNKLFKWVNHVG